MSRPRHPKRDRNQREIEAAFRRLGCSVLDLSSLPGHALDLLIGCAGIDQRVEVKRGDEPPSRRKLTASEADAIESWRGRPVAIVSSTDDAIRLVYALRREATGSGGPG